MTDNMIPSRAAGDRPEWRLSDRIRRAREHAGLEQRELAERAGISPATVSAAETGRATPHRSTLRLIAAATGVAFDWLAVEDELEHDDDEPFDSGVCSTCELAIMTA
jgi:transcriptional regulator with XRE-family HTH domain